MLLIPVCPGATTTLDRSCSRRIYWLLWINKDLDRRTPLSTLLAIVWIRRHVASENPSAIYLSTLAINDLVYLIARILKKYFLRGYAGLCARFIAHFTLWLEPLLVLSFSVVRLIAIRRPLQVCCIISRFRSTENSTVVERQRDAQ